MFLLGYNTNGFAHHRIEDACAILGELGFRSVALTIERSLLEAMDAGSVRRAADSLRPIFERNQLSVTVETGSRFFLNPRIKHQPTLISADRVGREQRINFLKACIDLAAEIGAESVSLWSGSADEAAEENTLRDRLLGGLREVMDHARTCNVRMSFEPEPGMFIDTMAKYRRLHDDVGDPLFGLTLDLGHVHCLDDGDLAAHILEWREKLWNVHIEDMRRGVHDHLMFGDGDMQFAPIFAALREIAYSGPIHVELSRHSHDAVEVARKSFLFLSRF